MDSTVNSDRLQDRGAEWHKWDLHIHTPASVEQYYGDKQQEQTWEAYLKALENLPPEVKAVGINDYFTIDGYKRVVAARESGRLPNLELILPVVELRIKAFAGSSKLKKINFHVVFSNDLTIEEIESFFLLELKTELKLGENEFYRGGLAGDARLTKLGERYLSSLPDDVKPDDSPLTAGFSQAAVDVDDVYKTLQGSLFKGKYLTALGINEYRQHRWEGAGGAQKMDLGHRCHFFFAASPSVQDYEKHVAKNRKSGIHTRILNCSDAHYYADSGQPNRLGTSNTWIKADLTFEGLVRAISCFDRRVFVGNIPPKVEKVRDNQTKYIRSVEIRKIEDSSLKEVWFDCEIPLNTDLVAIIGNQGQGKSALTDVIALCGDTKTTLFSFLSPDKFRDANKADEFYARLVWEDGSESEPKRLGDHVDPQSVERVRYVPQGFFESATNETNVEESGSFYGEIKKAIFSHIPKEDKLDRLSLDELLNHVTGPVRSKLSDLRQELHALNRTIRELEEETSEDALDSLRRREQIKVGEVRSLRDAEPQAVEAPEGISDLQDNLTLLHESAEDIEKEISDTQSRRGNLKRKRVVLSQGIDTLKNQENKIVQVSQRLQGELDNEGLEINAEALIWLETDPSYLEDAILEIDDELGALEDLLNPNNSAGLTAKLRSIGKEITGITDVLEGISKEFQDYQDRHRHWSDSLKSLTSDINNRNSLAWLRDRIEKVENLLPQKLEGLKEERLAKTTQIHEALLEQADHFKRLTEPIRSFIESNELTRDLYKISFEITLSHKYLEGKVFDIVSQGAGTFVGKKQGRQRLNDIVRQYDVESTDGVIDLAKEIEHCLHWNVKNDPPTQVDIESVLKQGHDAVELYDLLYGLTYLSPQYEISLNNKPLRRLSPGERGILLLVFYLVIDQGDEPLIIDQPEGNLNNQSIYERLVPVFTAAKNRRQVIIVTHNPNIAVVCDAEQIIHANIDPTSGYAVSYTSGSLENPSFNRLAVDLLEGTSEAFSARRDTYDGGIARRA